MSSATDMSFSDASHSPQESKMADIHMFPLLSLPSGLEGLLLSFLSAGKGGLKNILKLRSVCKTTQSWVDNLSKPYADLVFSKAQVTINSDLQSLRLFQSSSPPFGVTTLRLNVDRILVETSQEEDEWSCFCALWKLKLESLELHTTDSDDELHLNRHLTALLELDNLNSITLIDDLHRQDSSVTLPSSFAKVSELRMGRFSCGDVARTQFFSLLKNNSNLRVFTFVAVLNEDLKAVARLIDTKKDCPHFQLNLSLVNGLKNTKVFSRFTRSVLASRSQFRLKLANGQQSMLLHRNGLSLLTMVDFICSWFPAEQTLCLSDFTQLKEVNHVAVSDLTTPRQLRFPPSLEKIAFTQGIPSCANLPEKLKNLGLMWHVCDRNQFVPSMVNLSRRCPKLEELSVNWNFPQERDPILSFESLPQGFETFEKLRRLGLSGERLEEDVETTRVALLNAFNWRRMELLYLRVGFRDSQFRQLPVLNEVILTEIIEGPSGESLIEIDIANESVTTEALPMLQKLKGVVAENLERRLETDGPGAWQRQFQ